MEVMAEMLELAELKIEEAVEGDMVEVEEIWEVEAEDMEEMGEKEEPMETEEVVEDMEKALEEENTVEEGEVIMVEAVMDMIPKHGEEAVEEGMEMEEMFG